MISVSSFREKDLRFEKCTKLPIISLKIGVAI